jgi:hypothetical protein
MFIAYGHNKKRLLMDRARYYSPEELQDRASAVSCNGIFLEVVPMHYQSIRNEIELLFACKVVSMFHVSLHNDCEIDTRGAAESLFMDTTMQTLGMNAAVENSCYQELNPSFHDPYSDENIGGVHRESACSDDKYFSEDNMFSNGKHTRGGALKRERRNVKHNHQSYAKSSNNQLSGASGDTLPVDVDE